MKVGENVSYEVTDGKLLIEVDLEHNGGVSKSGKTIRIASTEGNCAVDGAPNVKMGLNIYLPNPQR